MTYYTAFGMLTFTSVHFGISDVRCYSDGRTTYSSCWPPTALPLLIHFASSTVFFGSWSFVVCNDRITWLADLLTYLRTQKRRWMLFFLWIFIWPRIMEGWCRCCRPLSCSCWSGNSLSAVTVWLAFKMIQLVTHELLLDDLILKGTRYF